MINITLPCEIGMRITNNNGYEGRVIGYKIIGNGNPLSPSHIVLAETNEYQIAITDGKLPDSFEVIGF